MNPEIKRLQEQVAALERAVDALSRKVNEPKVQQIARPLDLASAQVIKDAMEQAGFTYP
jgi:phage shock protein A